MGVDDTIESIFGSIGDAAKISKYGHAPLGHGNKTGFREWKHTRSVEMFPKFQKYLECNLVFNLVNF